jgi:hypothetical protein
LETTAVTHLPAHIVCRLQERKQLTTIAFFLDDTFEELTYDMTTTVAEAVEELAGIIRLKQFHTFSLFECRRVITAGKTTELPQGRLLCVDFWSRNFNAFAKGQVYGAGEVESGGGFLN